MNLLIPLLLAVAVGDKTYDPEVQIDPLPMAGNRGICLASTGWWVVEEVRGEDANGYCYEYAAGSGREVALVAAIISTFDFNWKAYYNEETELTPIIWECNALDNDVGSWLNVCVDFRKHPEMLPLVCR